MKAMPIKVLLNWDQSKYLFLRLILLHKFLKLITKFILKRLFYRKLITFFKYKISVIKTKFDHLVTGSTNNSQYIHEDIYDIQVKIKRRKDVLFRTNCILMFAAHHQLCIVD